MLTKKTKKKYLQELNLNEDDVKRIFKREKKKRKILAEYTVYSSSRYGRISNFFFENLTVRLFGKYPKFFDGLKDSLILSGVKVLSKTYVSMMLFSSFLASILTFILFLTYGLVFGSPIQVMIVRLLVFTILVFAAASTLYYIYPSMIAGSRRREMKNDLPFVIVHMAAVAGSGAHPMAMFTLILNTDEYRSLRDEIKKIVNYVNLFGYSLSNALRTVSQTTPSKEFKELLNGIVATIESGGDLKSYLKGKADDALNTYKLERRKYVETLSTYSDIYTGVLIAAPLLFIVTLAIINILGGQIGGFDVRTLATIGTYGVIPLLNMGFILFLNIIQPE
ncbi:type II secretion system F family protein [Candidatus Woesearchaeota archaeon]|nr:type II secretion system F family protein [Candidatus Woesearchaeota archaeon]